MLNRSEAISILNNWGAKRIPHLFIIDFEMKAIQLFRLDVPLPGNVLFDFHNRPAPTACPEIKAFTFRKYPLPFAHQPHLCNTGGDKPHAPAIV
jgi:hypothetical protein